MIELKWLEDKNLFLYILIVWILAYEVYYVVGHTVDPY
jgi:hypothetical protein